jgi:hypothetical protein
VSVWTQGDAEAQEPATCTARSRLQLALHAQRDPLRDEIREVGRGLSLADTQTGVLVSEPFILFLLHNHFITDFF